MAALVIGWLLGSIIALVIIAIIFATGLAGIRGEQRKNGKVDPTSKESNFWW